jgi:DNA replication and repair protein RecF
MALHRLSIENLRCIGSADLEFDGGRNLICGPNASGKTSLLEAIYFLGRGRSFRSAKTSSLVRSGTDGLAAIGHLQRLHRSSVLGVRYGRDGLEGRIDGRPVSGLAELATLFPVQAIDPELHQLIEEGPQKRRRFLDWGVFHEEPPFVETWQRYQRALRQRNAALRSGAAVDLVRAWDGELIDAGTRVAAARERYLGLLQTHVSAVGERLLAQRLELQLSEGWLRDSALAEALERSWPRDVKRGQTQVGPHRADLQVKVAGAAAREHVSRGQQKLVAAALLLAQLRCDAEQGAPTAALLVDDPAAELDSQSVGRLLDEVSVLPVQLFITTLDDGHPVLSRLGATARFHVEHGILTRLI